jgi:transposase-like protein
MVASAQLDKLRREFDSLPPDERKVLAAYLQNSVRAQGFNLNRLIASKEGDGGVKCPHSDCQSIEVVKFGIRRGVQWYKCKSCGKTFSSVTNTLLSWTKKDFAVWKKYVKCMMDGRSVRKSAEICRVSVTTAFMWRHKILDALTQYVNSHCCPANG